MSHVLLVLLLAASDIALAPSPPPAPPPPSAQDENDTCLRLTDRERQVLKLVAEGRSNKEVAQVLGISVKTTMTHRGHVMEKLGLHDRTGLIKFALRRGVIRL